MQKISSLINQSTQSNLTVELFSIQHRIEQTASAHTAVEIQFFRVFKFLQKDTKMGCRSSKNTEEDDTKAGDAPKKATNAEADEDNGAQMGSSRTKKAEKCATDDDFAPVVEEALRLNFELLTFAEFKNYISSRYACEADESFQDEIIHKVIGEQFVKGCLAIKSV